jgi:hypothetical protein
MVENTGLWLVSETCRFDIRLEQSQSHRARRRSAMVAQVQKEESKMSATATQPKRPAAAPLRFGNNSKSTSRERIIPRPTDGTQRIVVDRSDPFQSLLVGSFNMDSGVVETKTPGPATRPNTPASLFATDPLQASRDPVRLSAKIDFELDRVGQLAETLRELSSAPTLLPVPTSAPAPAPVPSLPVEVLERARKSARDAWCAVVLMGAFIVGGITWTANKLDVADKRIEQLIEQLQIQQTSASALRLENRQAFEELNDVKSRLKAMQYEKSTR